MAKSHRISNWLNRKFAVNNCVERNGMPQELRWTASRFSHQSKFLVSIGQFSNGPDTHKKTHTMKSKMECVLIIWSWTQFLLNHIIEVLFSLVPNKWTVSMSRSIEIVADFEIKIHQLNEFPASNKICLQSYSDYAYFWSPLGQ